MQMNNNNNLENLKIFYQFHPYHLTSQSPWPILMAVTVFSMLTSAVLWFNNLNNGFTFMMLGIITTIMSFILWFRDIIIEGTKMGYHTRVVQSGLSLGFSLFVVTEGFFFLSIFWAYLHSSLAPTVELGVNWPPVAIEPLSPITVPLLNTMLLVSSGAFVTWGHHALIRGNRSGAIIGTILTVILALAFTMLQVYEYMESSFNMSDGIYGTVFFFGTGFHGVHVIIGTLFIMVGMMRLIFYHFTKEHHMGYESSILYWHFVDIVWLVLYLMAYWWGG